MAALVNSVDRDVKIPSVREQFGRIPFVLFHISLVGTLVALLLSLSVPAINFFLFVMASLITAGLGLVWLIRMGFAVHSRRFPKRLAIAPMLVIMTFALLVADAPIKARWALSKGEFQNAVDVAPAPTVQTDWQQFTAPQKIGSYKITQARRVGDGVIYTEATGALADTAGFAYLPSGPFPELDTGFLERPQFEPIGDGWYTWTASW